MQIGKTARVLPPDPAACRWRGSAGLAQELGGINPLSNNSKQQWREVPSLVGVELHFLLGILSVVSHHHNIYIKCKRPPWNRTLRL